MRNSPRHLSTRFNPRPGPRESRVTSPTIRPQLAATSLETRNDELLHPFRSFRSHERIVSVPHELRQGLLVSAAGALAFRFGETDILFRYVCTKDHMSVSPFRRELCNLRPTLRALPAPGFATELCNDQTRKRVAPYRLQFGYVNSRSERASDFTDG
jgi:hypothetical protein